MNDYPMLPPDPKELSEELKLVTNPEEFQSLVTQLTTELKKKEYIRVNAFSELQDKIM